jgi:oxygen-independent coproporphyrinogen-3 oxidase
MSTLTPSSKREFPACGLLEGRASLYVHIPFCHSECTYCDFYRVSFRDEKANAFLGALEVEASTLPAGFRAKTLYVGGGTPSALKESQLERLLEILRPFQERDQEYTFEVNPRSITPQKAELLSKSNVTRVSFGAQTFHNGALEMLGRRHRGDDIERAYRLLKDRIPSVSMDLIFALPGETLADWESDLARALALAPDHLSVYSLIYEAGTPITQRVSSGELSPVSEELERELFLHAIRRLVAAGYEHYEVSSYSKPGHRSAHNQGYWRQSNYVGLGPGACSTLGYYRYTNVRDLEKYILGLEEEGSPPREEERLSETEKMNEFILLGLRTADGLDPSEFRERWGVDFFGLCDEKLKHLGARGLIYTGEGRVRLTLEGLCVADRVISELMQ